jgi:cytochrome c-type biogenesis protein CcmE
MRRDRRFFAGLGVVTLAVTWLIWTGISDTMVYYLTPTELMARAEGDPLASERGVRVSGHVVPGSYAAASGELLHTFQVFDPDEPEVVLTVHFRHPIPDTFNDEAEVVMEGRYLGGGIFEASEVLTKCGSRYEAVPDEEAYTGNAPDAATGSYGAQATGGSYAPEGYETKPDAEEGVAPHDDTADGYTSEGRDGT